MGYIQAPGKVFVPDWSDRWSGRNCNAVPAIFGNKFTIERW